MAITRVQGGTHPNGAASSTTVAVTLGATVGVGNMLCVSVGWSDAGGTTDTITVSDDKSNVYTIVDKTRGSSDNFSFSTAFIINVTNAPLTITATISSARTFATILVDEYSGVATSSAIDGHTIQEQPSVGTGANLVTSGNISTSVNGDLVYGSTVDITGAGTITKGTNFTQRISVVSTYMTEDLVQGSFGSIAATFTASSGADRWITAVMAFKTAVAAVSPLPPAIFTDSEIYQVQSRTLIY